MSLKNRINKLEIKAGTDRISQIRNMTDDELEAAIRQGAVELTAAGCPDCEICGGRVDCEELGAVEKFKNLVNEYKQVLA